MRKVGLVLNIIFLLLPCFAFAQQPLQPRGPEPAFVGPIRSLVLETVATGTTSTSITLAKPPLAVPVVSSATHELTANFADQASTTSDKLILVSLKDQSLTYFEGTSVVGQFKISSGIKSMPTPPGDYSVLAKKPLVDYKGPNYDFPRTKWNLLFKKGNPLSYYIHGAYWHHNFGRPMSHGCINVSYADMEGLYNWADVGTKIMIE